MHRFRLLAGLPTLIAPAFVPMLAGPMLASAVAEHAWSQTDQAAAAPASPPAIDPAPLLDPAIEARVRERLGRTYAQRARNLLQRDAVFLGILDSSEILLEQATRLVPDNPFVWRLTLDLANAMEDGDPEAAVLVDRALERLTALEPEDEVIRLRRLISIVSKKQTAEERIAAYRLLLEPANIEKIGSRVAARLAFDLALLLQRTGDRDGYKQALLSAIDLDPSYPQATEMAAGYFRTLAPGPVEEASALRAAILANPSRPAAATALVELCMRTGAYGAASDILNVTAEILARPTPDDQYDAVLADFVLALWGSGRIDDALAVVRTRQKQLDIYYIAELDRRGVPMTTEQRRDLHLPPSEVLLTTAAPLLVTVNPTGAADELAGLSKAFDFRADIAAAEKAPTEIVTQILFDGASLQYCLGGSVDEAERQLERAARIAPIPEAVRTRYDGWRLIRTGDPAGGREKLRPLADKDAIAALGVAEACEALGDKKEAARLFLQLARDNAPNAIGLWARERLWGLLGKRVSIMPGAESIEQVARLPEPFLDLMNKGSGGLMLRIYPRATDVSPFDAMVFDIELLNRSDWPLAVSPDGPVNDTMTVTATVNVPRREQTLPPFAFLTADRLFTIPPGGTLRVPIDVSLTDAAIMLREDPLAGALMSIHAISNWRTTSGGLEPGPLGLEVESPEIHVGGIRLTKEWVEAQIASLSDRTKPVDPDTLVMLAHAIVRAATVPDLVDEPTRQALAAAPAVVADATARVSPQTRAWLVFAGPRPKRLDDVSARDIVETAAGAVATSAAAVPELEPYEAVLRSDSDSHVRIAWIASRAKRPEEPLLVQSLTHPDPQTVAFAKSFQSWMSDAVEERRRRLNLTQ